MASPPFAKSVTKPGDLHLFHRNARVGDVELIESSLLAHGQYRPLTINLGTHTGRPNEVLVGNHTLKAVRNLAERYPDDERWHNVLCHWVDVDDDEASRIVLVDNRASERGRFDDTALVGLLDSLDSLEGTGYTDAQLADLEAALDDSNAGAPGSADYLDPPDEDAYNHQYAVTVICTDEADQQQVYERLRDEGMTCKVVTV